MEVRVNCSNRQRRSETKRKQSVFTSHLLQIILQHNGSRTQRGGGGLVGQAAVEPACREQKAFLSRNAVHQVGSPVLALQLSVSQGFGFTRRTHTVEGFGKAGPQIWEIFCSLMTLRLCPAIAGQRFACRVMLQLYQNSFHIGV